MSQSDDWPHFPPSWMRFEYMNVTVPSSGGTGLTSVRRPALVVIPRPANSAPGLTGHGFVADGLLDTGADRPAMPMWLLQQQGIPIYKDTRRIIYSASGPFWAYSAKVGMEIQIHDAWFDIGVSDVLVPDTQWSRDPSARRPLLLGLDGFFDRVDMYINHSREEFWLRLPTA